MPTLVSGSNAEPEVEGTIKNTQVINCCWTLQDAHKKNFTLSCCVLHVLCGDITRTAEGQANCKNLRLPFFGGKTHSQTVQDTQNTSVYALALVVYLTHLSVPVCRCRVYPKQLARNRGVADVVLILRLSYVFSSWTELKRHWLQTAIPPFFLWNVKDQAEGYITPITATPTAAAQHFSRHCTWHSTRTTTTL